jgi:pyridoxal 5'-phosphate synthase pdxS subunit
LGEALRRINEGAAMIRSKGEAGSGNIVEAVRHMRAITESIKALAHTKDLKSQAREMRVPVKLVKEVAEAGKLPVVLFCAGGEGIFVGSGIFKSNNPRAFAKAIVNATTHFDDPKVIVEASLSLGKDSRAMEGLDLRKIPESELLAPRGN